MKLRAGDPLVSPHDFVPHEEDPREKAKDNILGLFSMLNQKNLLPEDVAALRLRIVSGLRDEGIHDPESLFEEVFTAWDNAGNK
jgi:hypothetical protein